jgi:hypothetical protein
MAKSSESYTFDGVVQKLRIDPNKLKRLVSEGEISAYRKGDVMMFLKREIDELSRKGTGSGSSETASTEIEEEAPAFEETDDSIFEADEGEDIDPASTPSFTQGSESEAEQPSDESFDFDEEDDEDGKEEPEKKWNLLHNSSQLLFDTHHGLIVSFDLESGVAILAEESSVGSSPIVLEVRRPDDEIVLAKFDFGRRLTQKAALEIIRLLAVTRHGQFSAEKFGTGKSIHYIEAEIH